MKNKAIVRNTSTHFRSLETEALQSLLINDSTLIEAHKERSGISYCRFRYLQKEDSSSDFFNSNTVKSFTTNAQTFMYTLCRNMRISSKANAWIRLDLDKCCKMYMFNTSELLNAVYYLAKKGFITTRNCIDDNVIYVQFNYSKLVKCKLKPSGFLHQVLVDRENKETSIAAVLRNDSLYDFMENRLLSLVKKEMLPF